MENIKIIDEEICAACGGMCCKKSGCDYLPDDFKDLGYKAILEILEPGNISVVALLDISVLPNGQKTVTPFLYLRARNIDRDVVDLFSFKKTCSMLTETGCSYLPDDRPSMGRNLVPVKEVDKLTGMHLCYPYQNPLENMKKWESYQKPLAKVVKRLTGMSVEEKLLLDIENVFYDFLTENLDGVSKLEYDDMRKCIYDLVEIYPEICQKAVERTKMIKCVLEKKD